MNKEFKRGFSFTNDNRTRERIPELSTEDRIRQSWNSVGGDLRKSMDRFDSELKHVEENTETDKLNSRPRKCLGYKTPYEVFFELTGIDASQLGVVHL